MSASGSSTTATPTSSKQFVYKRDTKISVAAYSFGRLISILCVLSGGVAVSAYPTVQGDDLGVSKIAGVEPLGPGLFCIGLGLLMGAWEFPAPFLYDCINRSPACTNFFVRGVFYCLAAVFPCFAIPTIFTGFWIFILGCLYLWAGFLQETFEPFGKKEEKEGGGKEKKGGHAPATGGGHPK